MIIIYFYENLIGENVSEKSQNPS